MTGTIYLGADMRPLEQGWTLMMSEPGQYQVPAELPRNAFNINASVPGTVAAALTEAGLFDPASPAPLHGKDVWYRRSLSGETPGPAVLRFEGLATIAEIFVNGVLRHTSESMFEPVDLPLDLSGEDELVICFRALQPHLEKKGPRARWRPQMMDQQGLRLVRTTLLGHMPGWCPEIHPVGPFRPISLIRPSRDAISDLRIGADLDEFGTGVLTVEFREAAGAEMAILCCGRTAQFERQPDGRMRARLDLPAVAAWWPRTHGEPTLHDVTLAIDGRLHSLGLVGFRRIEVDHDEDGKGFGLKVNGVPVFCRGAVWTNADILRLPGTAEAYAPWLALAAEANMNMIRIGGTMTYETADFFRLCDRLGIMVWQDLMFANFDYPTSDEAFARKAVSEVDMLLGRLQGHPSLAVVAGGSEVFQQGAMLGLPERIWKGEFFTDALAHVVRDRRPDVAYVPNSPYGGSMPFVPNEGVGHYYGVGAYQRPLEDARRAKVRFAAECLAFAHVPQQRTLDAHLPVAPVHDSRWKARVPRDRGASWDFEDVRDHYLAELYGVDRARLRREDPAAYLDHARATTAEVVTETFAEWRRHGSSCRGALTWTLQDLEAGPGWGVIDATGEPKPVWYALKRAFRPLQVLLTDEGTNGLDIHLINEGPTSESVTLEIACLREGAQPVVSASKALSLDLRSSHRIPATDLFGAFFDTTYAYRFGPPSHDVTVARLLDTYGAVLSEAFHFPLGRQQAHYSTGIEHAFHRIDGVWWLDLSTDRFAQSVHLDLENFRPEDDWFHLAPGRTKRIRLHPRDGAENDQKPRGTLRHLCASRSHPLS
ncbi:beta-mannosidase [Rhizobium rosettiformans]|uniref:beta-mannosidase n=2 Tax=Rhizobium rosettiformans TaxID=1368430 RepID=A0A4S8PWY5_9HYPH|nr:glycoside hydrolase family 2 protein [Rhizobium rosettiformans]MBB5277369.1 beta-mannosidase [Rhizobium rosettiformans]THV34412.1 glycoside hydrolase family 2 protein [Rhizobium rosettiformans W3]